MKIITREVPPRAAWALEQAGVHPLLARLFAARGVLTREELDNGLQRLLPPEGMKNVPEAARVLADAIAANRRLCIVADYDCDGATACAVAIRGLRLLGAKNVEYLVPDRVVDGYGLTPPIAQRVKQRGADLLITVDNGIASLEGVAHAKSLGMQVLVTDHHLPAMQDDRTVIPAADVIVNPNQPGCSFASKALAGVGVMFYVLLALRAELRARGAFKPDEQPRLDVLLDLVALGTVADVVKLDANNRRLVAQGLKRIRAARMQPGLRALFAVAGRDPRRAASFDFGFALGPRVNAAGRLEQMTLGIECLLTDDQTRADELAHQLDAINRERREVEAGMREQAEGLVEQLMQGLAGEPPAAVALYDPDFHEGVVGIVASRIKDRLHRPSFVFALGRDGLLKGSGRSIPGFHLRDALDLVAKRHPELLRRFGGHAMAAGCTLAADGFERFALAFDQVAREWLDADTLTRTLSTDGTLEPQWFAPAVVQTLDAAVWGPSFEAPLFCDVVEVVSQRLVGERHLKLGLRHAGQMREAIWFGHTEPLAARSRIAYRLNLDEYEGRQRVQMVVEAAVNAD